MRKLFIMFVAIATIGVLGCNQPIEQPVEGVDSTIVDTTQAVENVEFTDTFSR
jgi:hypothetical protein